MASQITSITIVYSAVYSAADLRKYQSSASLAFVRGINRGTDEFPVQMASNAEMFPFDDVIMEWLMFRYRFNTNIKSILCFIRILLNLCDNTWYIHEAITDDICVSLNILNISWSTGFQHRGNKGNTKMQFPVTDSLLQIQFTPILYTLTRTKHAIPKVFQNVWQLYDLNTSKLCIYV